MVQELPHGYLCEELPRVIEARFPAAPERRGILGHSMGGHGALVHALREPGKWRSAFAPIANPCAVPWGEKAFRNYLGPDRTKWEQWDASILMRKGSHPEEILVDQGDADPFLQRQLKPEALEDAAKVSGQKLTLRRHIGYDHSYWFIQTFVADHLHHHAQRLGTG